VSIYNEIQVKWIRVAELLAPDRLGSERVTVPEGNGMRTASPQAERRTAE